MQHFYPSYGSVPMPLRPRVWGLGDLSGQLVLAPLNFSTAGTTTASLVATGLTTAATFDLEPFSKAALTIAAGLSSMLKGVIDGCGPTCTAASQAVNEAEPLLLQNVNNYVSQPVRTVAMQQQALAVFDNYWNQVSAFCQKVGGNGGTNCIKDRTQGSCKWTASKGGWSQVAGVWKYTPYGPAGSGNDCWNWFTGYRDPIAGDPGVVADTAATGVATNLFGAASGSGSAGSGIDPTLLLLLLAAGALVVIL